MQFEDRSQSKSLSDLLDQALARLRAGESVEVCLADYPEHASALEPLLRTGDLLRAEAAMPLPAELEDWLSVGARDLAAIAVRMAPKYAKQPRAARPATSVQSQRVDILDQALMRMRAGESIEASLADHAELADELQPLLLAADLLRAEAATPLPPDLEAWLPAGARDFTAIAEQAASRNGRRRVASRPLTLQRTAIAVAIVAAMMGAVDTASAQSLPGETLYQWKRTKEDISLALVTDPDQRSHLMVEYAGRRLNEFNKLVAKGDAADSTLVSDTLTSLLDNLQAAITEDQKTQVDDVSPMVKQILSDTKSALTQAATVAPESAPVLDQANVRAEVIAQEIPAGVATSSQPTDTATVTASPAVTNTPVAHGSIAEGSSTETATPTTGAPIDQTAEPLATTTIDQSPSPSPTSAVSEPSTVVPPGSTDEPTPTADPVTVVPPTAAPTDTAAPPSNPSPATSTPAPAVTAVPTDTAAPPSTTNTPPPTATPLPTDEPTPRPTATPLPTTRPTRTPTDTPTPTPTRTPTATPTPTRTPTATPLPPTDTPTPPPTDTPTPPPTDTPTPPPTDTPTPPPTDTPTPPPTDMPTPPPTTQSNAGAGEGSSTPTATPQPNEVTSDSTVAPPTDTPTT
jgi:hypothetical protein